MNSQLHSTPSILARALECVACWLCQSQLKLNPSLQFAHSCDSIYLQELCSWDWPSDWHCIVWPDFSLGKEAGKQIKVFWLVDGKEKTKQDKGRGCWEMKEEIMEERKNRCPLKNPCGAHPYKIVCNDALRQQLLSCLEEWFIGSYPYKSIQK